MGRTDSRAGIFGGRFDARTRCFPGNYGRIGYWLAISDAARPTLWAADKPMLVLSPAVSRRAESHEVIVCTHRDGFHGRSIYDALCLPMRDSAFTAAPLRAVAVNPMEIA